MLPQRTIDTANEPVIMQEEVLSGTSAIGRIAGGTYLKDLSGSEKSEAGPFKEVDFDLPLTFTEVVQQDGREYILLKFVPDDKENPFNWSPARKTFMSSLLCLMTLFIGLATTAYSSGIGSMVKDLNTTTELGQMGLFCFNMVRVLFVLFPTSNQRKFDCG